MYIALCDDDTDFVYDLKNMLQNYAQKTKLDISTDYFPCGEDLLAKTSTQNIYDIIFMDVYLTSDDSKLTGIDTIRNMNIPGNTQVVFTTTSREHAVEAFGLDAAHYLIKPLTQEDVSAAMERCMERSNKRPSKTLDVKTKQGIVYIPIDNIIFIEVSDKICQIHTVKNCIQTYSSLDSLSELLDSDIFIRAQRSYIVNMKYIDSFQYDRLLLTNNREIMLSRKTKSELKDKYQKFLFDLARRGEA